MVRPASGSSTAPSRVLFLAASGYGTTTALEGWAGQDPVLPAAALLEAGATGASRVAVDDLSALEPDDQASAIRALSGVPSFALACRRPLTTSVRSLLRGTVFERGPEDLALSLDQVARVLGEDFGVDGVLVARPVHDLTCGWPALVQLAGDALLRTEVRDLREAVTSPGTAAASYVETRILADLPRLVRSGLAATADLEVQSPQLTTALGSGQTPAEVAAAFAWLRATGLLRRTRAGLRLVPVVADVLRRACPIGPDRARLLVAARWYADQGHPLPAARTLLRAGRATEAAATVLENGDAALAAGQAAAVVEVMSAVPPEARGTAGRLLLADALRTSGDAPAAQRAFAPLLDEARSGTGPRSGRLPAGLAWRASMVHYMLADYPAALATLDETAPSDARDVPGTADPTSPDRDRVELLACRANVLSMLGREAEADEAARAAVSAAHALGDDRATASAHLAAANTTTGAAKEAHLAAARVAADRAGDVVLAARALVNQACCLLASADVTGAVETAAEAVRVAELGSPPGLAVVALHNLGEAERRLGRFEDAELHLRRSVALARDRGLRRADFGLRGLGELYRELGQQDRAEQAYRAAVELARDSDEVQVLVPALSGLARLQAQVAGRPASALAAAEEALVLTSAEFAWWALVARGWVAAADGRHDLASAYADQALDAARAGGAADAVAEALELRGVADDHPVRRRDALREALAIWVAAGAAPAAERVRVLLGRVPGADEQVLAEGREAARSLRRRGVGLVHGVPLDAPDAAVHLQLAGGFEARVGGEPVPLPAWRSRQARTLVKILAARRGHVVPRSELCELLWPDDEPARTGHRLSVLLSAVRGVLDPDRSWPVDHFIVADSAGLALDLRHVRVDVEQLLQDASYATALLRAGEHARAGELLATVVATATGDALADEPYAGWADGLREEFRAAVVRCLRNLAELRRRAGEHDEAAALLVRLLGRDPYDERAHHALVRVLQSSGRHGEARRAFERWNSAMRDIDAPAPDPRTLGAAPATTSQSRLVLTPR